MTTPIVHMQGVSKSYVGSGETDAVLHRLDLTLLPGEKASLIGPSGCGKSTLLLLIAGLLRPDAGTISIDAVAMSDLGDLARAEVRASRIGIALQSDNLIPFLSAVENVELAVAFGPRRRRGYARARAFDLLERFGVAHRAHQRPRQLSGGEAQRVALAVSLANDPGLLLADEVVAQLDEETAADVITQVLHGDFAVLYVTHEVAIADLADQRYAMSERGVSLR